MDAVMRDDRARARQAPGPPAFDRTDRHDAAAGSSAVRVWSNETGSSVKPSTAERMRKLSSSRSRPRAALIEASQPDTALSHTMSAVAIASAGPRGPSRRSSVCHQRRDVRVEQQLQSPSPSNAACRSAGRGASKSALIQTWPLARPGLRRAASRKATSLASRPPGLGDDDLRARGRFLDQRRQLCLRLVEIQQLPHPSNLSVVDRSWSSWSTPVAPPRCGLGPARTLLRERRGRPSSRPCRATRRRSSARPSAPPLSLGLRTACSSPAVAARPGCAGTTRAAVSKLLRDLHFGLAQDDARLLLARGLRFARHGVLQRRGNHDVAHVDRLHRGAPRVRCARR